MAKIRISEFSAKKIVLPWSSNRRRRQIDVVQTSDKKEKSVLNIIEDIFVSAVMFGKQ